MGTAPAPRALVVVTGDDIHHDLLSAATVFQQLGSEAGFATQRGMGMNRFVEPRPATGEAATYLLYTAGGAFPGAQQRALAEAIAGGKGLVGIHGAGIMGVVGDGLDPEWQPMYELLGNRYLSHGPGHHEGRHTIEIIGDHPVVEGVEDFELFDEYYEFELADDDVTVFAQRQRADGVVIPVGYAREVGDGRVVYLALGHDMRAWGEPAFRTLVRQALQWTAGLR